MCLCEEFAAEQTSVEIRSALVDMLNFFLDDKCDFAVTLCTCP